MNNIFSVIGKACDLVEFGADSTLDGGKKVVSMAQMSLDVAVNKTALWAFEAQKETLVEISKMEDQDKAAFDEFLKHYQLK